MDSELTAPIPARLAGPSEHEAHSFAVMLQAGLPPSEAILYFTDLDDPGDVAQLLAKWQRSRAVKVAMVRLMGKPWQEMSTEEMIKSGLDFHYRGLAYVLFSHNYAEAGPQDKAKLDSARAALEAKLAGLAGKTDALSRFFDDISTGKLKLQAAAVKLPPGLN